MKGVSLLLALLLATIASALLVVPDHAAAADGRMKRAGVGAGPQRSRDRDDEGVTKYLVNLSRSITRKQRDLVLDALLRQNAVVVQEYDYKVYKGILFSVKTVRQSDKVRALETWQANLRGLEGINSIEEDQIVSIS